MVLSAIRIRTFCSTFTVLILSENSFGEFSPVFFHVLCIFLAKIFFSNNDFSNTTCYQLVIT